MKLSEINIGQDAIIDKVECEENSLRKHILDMGLTPGTEVTLVKTAPMGDPLELRVRGYGLTLRKDDAAKIEVYDIHQAHLYERKPVYYLNEHPKTGEKTYKPKKSGSVIPKGQKLSFALAGNQNCGKTTLFNQLTGSNQHVGNFPGVTVDRKEGTLKAYPEARVTDLPGIYSLSPYTTEEIVTRDFLLEECPDGIINIIDATNIERNLFLTMQLMELEIPMVIALNMMDEVRENGGTIDVNGLEAQLGVPVIPISAIKNEGIDELVDHAINVTRERACPGRVDFCNPNGDTGAVHRCIHSIEHLIEDHANMAAVPVRFAATQIADGDKSMLKRMNLIENEVDALDHIIVQMEEERGLDREAALADMRFSFIENLCNHTVVKPEESRERARSRKIDRILTGKYTGIPAFVCIMGVIFYLTFGVIGAELSSLLDSGINWITEICDKGLTEFGMNSVAHSLIIDGIFVGVGSVLSFLPVIVVLFFFLSLLEDSGYMARVAFIMDKLLRKIGLSGRSFVPMLIGFGCSVPAIMATRTLPSERDRKMTIFLTPFMSCSAKLPIYGLFTAAFFPNYKALVMICLYFGGMAVGILMALIMKKMVFTGEPVPFVMELPNYRLPSMGNVVRLIGQKAKDFITKAFTIIFVASVIIWFLQTFDLRLNVVQDSSDSILAALGNIMAPMFAPMGLGDWRISTAFITGFVAKESVVSTLTVLVGGGTALTGLFTAKAAASFLAFSLLYTPCVAAIAAVKRELGRRYALYVVLIQCGLAWLAGFLISLI